MHEEGKSQLVLGSEATAVAAGAARTASEKMADDLRAFEAVVEELNQRLILGVPAALRRKQIVDCATELFGLAPSWVAFFRATMARGGLVSKLFVTPEERKDYWCSPEHHQILEMLTALRSRALPVCEAGEPSRMITMRIHKCLHDFICDEANELEMSVNKLCISRILMQVDTTLLPQSAQKRRGRRPGSKPLSRSQPTSSQLPSGTTSL
ncbi:MAG: hypothetical protein ACK56Q_19880 [Pirellulaceae bacterium]